MADDKMSDVVVDAQMFRLVDREGRVRGIFGMDPRDDSPCLVMLDSDRTVRVTIGLEYEDGKSGAGVWLSDRNGEPVAGMKVNTDGRGSLNFYDAGGERLLGFGITADGAPHLEHCAAIGGTFALGDLGKSEETDTE